MPMRYEYLLHHYMKPRASAVGAACLLASMAAPTVRAADLSVVLHRPDHERLDLLRLHDARAVPRECGRQWRLLREEPVLARTPGRGYAARPTPLRLAQTPP